jgi:hypothetical protein
MYEHDKREVQKKRSRMTPHGSRTLMYVHDKREAQKADSLCDEHHPCARRVAAHQPVREHILVREHNLV